MKRSAASNIDAKDLTGYNICRALLAASEPGKHSCFEVDISQELERTHKTENGGFLMPSNIPMAGQRATSATAYGATINAGQGGANLVATNLLAGSFIDVLRNKTRVIQAGATLLPGLTGNTQIPRRSAAAQAVWLSPEGADITEAEGVFDGGILLTPKTVGARAQVTRQMLLQATPEISALVADDFAAVVALAIDLAAINGTGASGQPTGLLNKAGIASIAMGANGAALASLDPLLAMETALATANVDDAAFGYLTNAKVVGEMRTLKTTANQYMWDPAQPALIGQTGKVAGYLSGIPVYRSGQVPNTLTKGTSGAVCSAAIFGNWSDLVIGEWGVLEILPNPYGAGFNNGSIDIRVLNTIDIGVRHLASFCTMADII